MAAEEGGCIEGFAARDLDTAQPQSSLTAGDEKRVVQDLTRRG